MFCFQFTGDAIGVWDGKTPRSAIRTSTVCSLWVGSESLSQTDSETGRQRRVAEVGKDEVSAYHRRPVQAHQFSVACTGLAGHTQDGGIWRRM